MDISRVRRTAGNPLKGVAYLVVIASGLIGFIICLVIVNDVIGFWGVVLGLMFFPIILAAAPWYALVAWGNPIPLILVYGGGIIAAVIYGIGASIAGD